MLAKKRIGLLGGSFNPAHEGHFHISHEALKRLDLDEVWWLVSPQNPLKQSDELAEYATRFKKAESLAKSRRIRVLDIEAREELNYTIDTLRFLKQHYPKVQFVWLMGADNLASFHRWRAWRTIARLMPIAVLDRAPYALRALQGRFAQQFRMCRLPAASAPLLAATPPPAWVYVAIPRSSASATQLRKTLGSRAFLMHN